MSQDEAALKTAETGNSQALVQAEQAVSQDEAALKPSDTGNSQSLAQAEQAVSQDEAALKTAETSNSQSLAQAEQAVSQDEAALKTAETSNSQSLAQAEQAVSQDEAALKTAQDQQLPVPGPGRAAAAGRDLNAKRRSGPAHRGRGKALRGPAEGGGRLRGRRFGASHERWEFRFCVLYRRGPGGAGPIRCHQ